MRSLVSWRRTRCGRSEASLALSSVSRGQTPLQLNCMSLRSPGSPSRCDLRWRRPARSAALAGASPSPGPGFLSMSPARSLTRARYAGLPRPLAENPVPARLCWRRRRPCGGLIAESRWRVHDVEALWPPSLGGGGTPTPREGGLQCRRRGPSNRSWSSLREKIRLGYLKCCKTL